MIIELTLYKVQRILVLSVMLLVQNSESLTKDVEEKTGVKPALMQLLVRY